VVGLAALDPPYGIAPRPHREATAVSWGWIAAGVSLMLFLPVTATTFLVWLLHYMYRRYRDNGVRIFLEKPLFIIPRGQPLPDAEEVRFPSSDGLTLRGCYLRHTADRRKGGILFGLEFGSNRWACGPAVDFLRAAGYDVFTWEPRNQGDSDVQAGFEPLQWA